MTAPTLGQRLRLDGTTYEVVGIEYRNADPHLVTLAPVDEADDTPATKSTTGLLVVKPRDLANAKRARQRKETE